MVELRHLRYFVAVAEELHFTRAAERLYIAQPPLSQAIRQLEHEIGAPLLERTTRRVSLTPAGQTLLERARGILSEVDQATIDALRAERGEAGRLSVGFTGSVTYELLPTLVRAFKQDTPSVKLDLHGELLTPKQVDGLKEGSLDLGFLRPPVHDRELTLRMLRSEPLAVLLPDTHPLASNDAVELACLESEGLISYPTGWGSVLSRVAWDACAREGFVPRVVQEVHETVTLVSFVAANLGVALVPASVRHIGVTGVCFRPLAGEPATVELAVAWRTADASPLIGRLLHTVDALFGASHSDEYELITG